MNKIKKTFYIFIIVIGVIFLAGKVLPDDVLTFTESNNIITEHEVIPGGQSVGIEMSVKGALIVGVENDAGPEVGDMLISVNGKKINSPDDLKTIVVSDRKKVNITVLRNNKKISYNVKPYYDSGSNSYRLGFWIKERIAGIGTLTFYDPESGKFASLGHGIYEAETGTLLQSKKGSILNTRVNQIEEGKAGTPGELGGVIYNFDKPVGSIEKNTEFGIYGNADTSRSFRLSEPVILACRDQVEKGDAYILSTIDGTKVEKFKIYITKVNRQDEPEIKSIEFKVTDKDLIRRCGGIVQGMSGSPIIQKNRLIGAVTHVFVNNPERGYGVFAEWMLDEING